MLGVLKRRHLSLQPLYANGGLAQLARALAWHARGHRFESGILHKIRSDHLDRAFFVILAAVLNNKI